MNKNELITEYIKEIRNKVGSFELKVQTSAALFNFFDRKGYKFYFCPKIKVSLDKPLKKTPDFLIKSSNKKDIIGEMKQSLPNPDGDDYDKKSAKDIAQLREYSQDLYGITTPHDVFLSSPSWCNDAIANYVEKIKNDSLMKDKIIILKYHLMKGNSHSQLSISKVYGNFSDGEINKEFEYKDHLVGEGDLDDIQGYYKIIYSEDTFSETPIEYIMMVLWHNVIPELLRSADVDKTIERIRKGENTLEFNLSELMEILDKLYTLESSQNELLKQFSKDIIIRALDSFKKINKAEKLTDSRENPKYRITHTKIAHGKSDFLEYLIFELNKDDFEKRADVEIKKVTNSSLEGLS